MEKKRDWTPASITVHLQPQGKELSLPRPKTVLQLLNTLGIRRGTALVIRDNGLLTPDREVLPNDTLIVRVVTSSG